MGVWELFFFFITQLLMTFSLQRIDEIGYDRKGRYYYVLDDNRLYRRTNPPLPPPPPSKPSKPQKSPKKSARALRASKRRMMTGAAVSGSDEEERGGEGGSGGGDGVDHAADNYTGEFEWECVAVSLHDYQQFIEGLRKTRDADEKELRDTLLESVIPFMENIEEEQQRKRMKREKELLNLQLLASAKRSSRIADRAEKERQEQEALEAARRHDAEIAAARKEEEKRKKMLAERHSRVEARERRMKDREEKRAMHENELQRIQQEQQKLERGESRQSERHIQAELERRRTMLRELNSDDHWVFDCSGCGLHGQDLDDGEHSVACEKCGVWQHSKCLGISQQDAEREDFHFICADCKRKEEEAKRPKVAPLKFRIASPSPFPNNANGTMPSQEGQQQQAAPVPPSSLKKENINNNNNNNNSNNSGTILPPLAAKAPSAGCPLVVQQKMPLPRQQAVVPGPPPGSSTFNVQQQRPLSSHSAKSPFLPSPIQNRPSISPTQGNRDVGPLAGFPPPPTTVNGTGPWTTPSAQRQQDPGQQVAYPAADTRGVPSSMLTTTPNGYSSEAAHSSPRAAFHSSGISPTKQPPPVMTGGLAGAPVMPPVEKLEPSPKLMGRSSVEEPIPPPVKPFPQEERKLQNSPPISTLPPENLGRGNENMNGPPQPQPQPQPQ